MSGKEYWDMAESTECGRYEPRAIIATGGLGVVEVVRDRWLERDVARKVLRNGGSERLNREARIMARLSHPNIVPVFDVGEDASGRLFYTMRLLRGSTLGGMVGSGLAVRVAALLSAVRAMVYAHSVGVVHRDLKPDNIMVGSFGEVQVVDWGLASHLDDPGASEGTAAFSAPEQLAGGPPDRRSDIYALGRTLWAMMLGCEPGARPSSEGLPPELVSVARRAAAWEPASRYPSCEALAADLDAWLAGEPVQAHSYGPVDRLRHRLRAALR